MLNVLRQSFKEQPYLKILLVAVGLGLVAYLGNYFFSGDAAATNEWVARVDGAEISFVRYRDAARNLDRYYRELLGTNFDQFRDQLRIPQAALDALVEEELIVQDARRLGLTNSKQDLAEQIRKHPGFQEDGRFIGAERYRDIVQRGFAGGVGAFERSLGHELLTTKWTNLVTEPVRVDAGEVEQAFRKRTEKTAIDYVILAAADRPGDAAVGAEDLQRWYDSHQEDYRREQSRRIRYVIIDRDSAAGPAASDAEIAEYYAANQGNYAHPEQRRASHVLFRVAPDSSDDERQSSRRQAESALERARQGEDFATLARSLSQDRGSAERGGDLDFFGRGDMAGPFEEAAFSTAPGELAPVVESPFGFHVILVTGSRAEGVTPLDEVRDDIRRTLELQKSQDAVVARANRLHGEIAAADRLDEVARREGLEVVARTVEVGERLPEIGASPAFAAALAMLQPGALSEPVQVAAGMALVAVDEILPPAVAPLEEVRDQVAADLRLDQARRAALATLEQALQAHPNVRALGQALDLELRSSGDLSPGQSLAGAGGPAKNLNAVLFGDGVRVGDRGVNEVPAGAIAWEVSRREPFDAARFASDRAQIEHELLAQRRLRYREAMVQRLREGHAVEVNHPMVARVGGGG